MVPGFKPFTSFKYSNKELLRCHYGDSNGIEKAKKAMGQDWKATACTNSTFFCTFLCSYCTTTTSIKQIDNNYPWSVLLSTTELTSKVQNSCNHELRRAVSLWFHSKVLNFWLHFYHNIDSFDSHFRWSFSDNRAREKEKNKLCHHPVISMVWMVWYIDFDQSVREESSS